MRLAAYCAVKGVKHLLVPKLLLGNAVWEAPASQDKASQSLQGRGSQAGALIVIHKFTDADLLQPGGLLAISRGLSEATPPDNAEKIPTTPEGSQQLAHKPRRSF